MPNMQKLRYLCNTGSLDNLIPLSEINRKNKKKYQKKGYILACCGAYEWYEKYPFLKGEPIYLNNAFIGGDYCYYYDDTCIFTLSFFPKITDDGRAEIEFMGAMGKNPEEVYRKMKKIVQEDFFKKDLSYVIGSDALVFDYFSRYYKKYPKDILYEVYLSIYTDHDYGFSMLGKDAQEYILSCKTETQKERTAQAVKSLPDEVTVYRGESSLSEKTGYSWTTDINVANFFAVKAADDHALIRKAKIRKEKIIEYINNRNEKEVLVNPDDLYDMEEIRLFTTDDVMDTEWEAIIENLNKFREILSDFPYEREGEDHGKEHMYRVLFLGLLLYYRETGMPLTEEQENALFLALALHDVGRTNDCEDESHGKESAERICTYGDFDMPYDEEMLHFLVTYHCIEDREAEKVAEEKNLPLLPYRILKDADALDRIRFGIRELDVNYLRTENAILYTQVAELALTGLQLQN